MVKIFLNTVAGLIIGLLVSVAVVLALSAVKAVLTEFGLRWVWNLAAMTVVAWMIYSGIQSIRNRFEGRAG